MLKSYFFPSLHPKGYLRVIADSDRENELLDIGAFKLEAEAVEASKEPGEAKEPQKRGRPARAK